MIASFASALEVRILGVNRDDCFEADFFCGFVTLKY
jgi:hypothetical protein